MGRMTLIDLIASCSRYSRQTSQWNRSFFARQFWSMTCQIAAKCNTVETWITPDVIAYPLNCQSSSQNLSGRHLLFARQPKLTFACVFFFLRRILIFLLATTVAFIHGQSYLSFDPQSQECALVLPGPGRSSSFDYSVNLFRGTL